MTSTETVDVLALILDGHEPDPDDVTAAVDLTDVEYADTILDVLPPGTDEHAWLVLFDPQLINRTRNTLSRLSHLGGQSRRTLPPQVRERLNHIEQRQRQAGWAKRYRNEQRAANDRDKDRKLSALLALAINDHRLACTAAGLEPEPHDLALWDVLDTLTVEFRDKGGHISLAEAIHAGLWRRRPAAAA